MSRLTVYDDATPRQPLLATEDATAIALELSAIGVKFERWDSPSRWPTAHLPTRCWLPTSRISTG